MTRRSSMLFVLALGIFVLAGCDRSEPRSTAEPSVRSTSTAAIGGPFQPIDQKGRAVSDRDLTPCT